MWSGWTKNLYLLYGREMGRMLKAFGETWLFDLAPPIVLLSLCLLVALGRGGAVAALAAVGCFLIAAFRHWRYRRALKELGFDPRLANYQILGVGLFSFLLLNSARAHRLSRRVQWKGRAYSTKGTA